MAVQPIKPPFTEETAKLKVQAAQAPGTTGVISPFSNWSLLFCPACTRYRSRALHRTDASAF